MFAVVNLSKEKFVHQTFSIKNESLSNFLY